MKRRMLVSLAVFPLLVFDVAMGIAGWCESQSNICVYFFYGAGCLSCEGIAPYISQLEDKYEQLIVCKFEVHGNRSNLSLLNSLFDKYGVSEDLREIPTVFLCNKCLIGEKQITGELEGIIHDLLGTGCVCPSVEEPSKMLTPISLLVVTWAALADSVNPCAIGVLIFLFSLLSASKDKDRLFRVGLAYVASIYLAYFLFGLGIISTIQVAGLSYGFYRFVGILAIIIGILNVKDFLRYRSLGFAMEIPQSLKSKLNSILTTATNPIAAFTSGFAVCLLELPCTGGPYFYILGLMAEKTTRASATPLLLYYNLIFVLPLILITVITYFGVSSIQRMTHLRYVSTRLLHLIIGTTMIALGALTLLGLI